jgi:protein-glutamine gamma-glutamyltransferase
MITIGSAAPQIADLAAGYQNGGVERETLTRLWNSRFDYAYASKGELDFELKLRREIVACAMRLLRGGMEFQTFRSTYCNARYWIRKPDGGFEKRRDVTAYDAVSDIFENGPRYATECATAMQIVYFGALSRMVPRDKFNSEYAVIYMMNWHKIGSGLRETGLMRPATDYFPGDRRYFANPEVNLETPEWQGENVIDLGDGTFYGHGVGRMRASDIIAVLNNNRRPGAQRSAYLMSTAGRPEFSRLYRIFG